MDDNGTIAQRGQPQDEPADIESGTVNQPVPSTEIKRTLLLKLYQAAVNGDWDAANEIYENKGTKICFNDIITKRKETALHIAAAAQNFRFVKELVGKMSADDLVLQNDAENTAFSLAAMSGKVELAEAMMNKKGELATTRGRNAMLPIYMAALLGHKNMVQWLYGKTKNQLQHKDKMDLLVALINNDIYDIALEMLEGDQSLATGQDKNKETALHALAQKSFSGPKTTNAKGTMHKMALELVEKVWNKALISSTDDQISTLIGHPSRLIFTAAENGNADFLTILIRAYPDLVFKVNENRHSIFHHAVLHRQENIFKLIHEIGSIKNLINIDTDNNENNMLHLAAQLPLTRSRLHIVPGAALQLQRELLWFEEVKKVLEPHHLEGRNRKKLTPEALLIRTHGGLMKQGENWMRGTANSCMVVATLIATVVFAAGFTVPGGNGQGSGIPIFLRKLPFKIFAVSNALSLITSVSSVLTFLSIMTSRYGLYDFQLSLPNKLMIGLSTLFVSIAAMLVAFVTALFLVFDHGHRLIWFAIPIAAIASVPVILFIWQHYRLFNDVVKSTYMSKSLFKPNKIPLFSAGDDDMKKVN